MSYSDFKSYVELKAGYNDNLNLGNSTNKQGGQFEEASLNIESPVGPGTFRYNFSWIHNPALTIYDTGYILPESQTTRNHLAAYKFKEDIPSILSFELNGQGEYNDADISELTYEKYSVSGRVDHAFSLKQTAGVEAKYSQWLYNKTTPVRSDNTKLVAANTSYIFPMQITGYVEYDYITNESNNLNYSFRGYGPTALLTIPLSSQNDLQLLCSQETRNYQPGFTDKSFIISPGFINKQMKFIHIRLEYSYMKNTSSIANREFVQNRYSGGLSISF